MPQTQRGRRGWVFLDVLSGLVIVAILAGTLGARWRHASGRCITWRTSGRRSGWQNRH